MVWCMRCVSREPSKLKTVYWQAVQMTYTKSFWKFFWSCSNLGHQDKLILFFKHPKYLSIFDPHHWLVIHWMAYNWRIFSKGQGQGKLKRLMFAAALLPLLFGNNVPGHTTRVPHVGFKSATNCIQFYAIMAYPVLCHNWGRVKDHHLRSAMRAKS